MNLRGIVVDLLFFPTGGGTVRPKVIASIATVRLVQDTILSYGTTSRRGRHRTR